MIIKPNWDIFKAKFSENPQENFEWFCYLLFCREYNKPNGLLRYKNQSGIETNPVELNNEVIGWQSKFYEGQLSTHKNDLISTLEKSKRDYPKITKIILYTNVEWTQVHKKKDVKAEKSKAQIDSEKKAEELNITIEWRTSSYFESEFVAMTHNDISKHFFIYELKSWEEGITVSGDSKGIVHNDGTAYQTIVEGDNNTINIVQDMPIEKKQFKPTRDWAKERIELSLESIGNRYITYNNNEYKNLNIKVNLNDLFESISNTNEFKYDLFLEKLKVKSNFEDAWQYIYHNNGVKYYHDLYKDNKKYEGQPKEVLFKSLSKNNTLDEQEIIIVTYSNLSSLIDLMLSFYLKYKNLLDQFTDIKLLKKNFFSIKNRELIEHLDILVDKVLAHPDTKLVEQYITMFSPYPVEKIGKILKRIKNIKVYILEFKKIMFKKTYKELPNLNSSNDLSTYLFKYSLISGEAMSGKTHLLSEIANIRMNSNKPTILIYAQKFDNNNDRPIQHIIKQLRLESYHFTDEDFLNMLNEWGKELNELVFLIIDAINEIPNKSVWRNNFIEFVSMVKKYPYIALTMSIRDVEKRVIFTQDMENYIKSNMVEVEHLGFKEIEYPVLKKFCKVFNVNLPTFPLTSPIFANPGLMFLFFETLKRKNIVDINEQVLKPNFIIEEYIKDRNKHFKEMNQLGDRRTYIHRGTNVVASKIVSMEFIEKVKYDDVSNDIAQIHSQLLEYLISEGILLEQLDSLDEVHLYFSYQRFGNYFIALYLLSVDSEEYKKIIFNLLNNYVTHQALVEALIIRYCESERKDFIDIFPKLFENKELNRIRYQCFSKSLRLPVNIERKITNFIDLGVDEKYQVLELLLSLVYEKDNKLNIDEVLHPLLMSLSLSERDYHWSIYLHHSFTNDGIVKHIITWAWEKEKEYELEDKSLYLYGLTLGWFLTSSNRELRDGTTKALVNLFTNRIDTFLNVLKEFEKVDDLYVIERLYAVGYGIVLRSSEQNGLKKLGEYIYQTFFDKEEVIEHIFLRDYAKLIVEYINNLMFLEIDMKKVMPPYNQHLDWDLSNEDIGNIEKYRDDYSRIYFSVIEGDFKAYIIYPYANHFLSLKIKDRPHPKIPKVRYNEFFDSLSVEQKGEYDKTRLKSSEVLAVLNNLSYEEFEEELEIDDMDNDTLETLRAIKLNQSNFKELLSPKQLKEYNDFIVKYKQAGRYENGLDVKAVKRLVFLEVIKLGWEKELFEDFDNNANFDRNPDTGTERISKKYQWIALYKVLAKLLDTYEFKEDEYKEIISEYRGMYQFSFKRDIDPSTILRLKKDNYKWWFDINTTFENYELSDTEWMNSCEKLPKLSQIVNLTKDNKNYLLLDTNFSLDSDKEGETYRNLYYHINSFIIKKNKEEKIVDWIKNQNFYARRMPESKYFHDPYLREYPNSEAYNNIDNDYNSQPTWDNNFKDSDNNIPDEVLLTATGYFKERGKVDHSINDSIEIKLPNKWFVNEMNLKQTLTDGEWISKQGEVAFLDPTVDSGNISTFNENGVLLADKSLLLNFLEKNGYTIFWILWGEKQVRDVEGFNNKDFLGIGEISGYGYFKGNEFIEHIDINWDEKK